MVGGTWIEHVTSSVSRKRSPTELTARRGFRFAAVAYAPAAPAFDKAFARVIELRVLLARRWEAQWTIWFGLPPPRRLTALGRRALAFQRARHRRCSVIAALKASAIDRRPFQFPVLSLFLSLEVNRGTLAGRRDPDSP